MTASLERPKTNSGKAHAPDDSNAWVKQQNNPNPVGCALFSGVYAIRTVRCTLGQTAHILLLFLLHAKTPTLPSN